MAKEEKRAEVIKDELAMMRKVLPEMTNSEVLTMMTNPVGRKKREAVTKLDDQKTPRCPLTSPALLGALVVDQSETSMYKASEADPRQTLSWFLILDSGHRNFLIFQVESDLTWVATGGVWAPSTCKQDQTVAFILPFR